MKGLLGFLFRNCWKKLVLSSFVGGSFIFFFLIQDGPQQLFLLLFTYMYTWSVEYWGIKGAREEYIPRVALPFSKATFVLYEVIKTMVYYLLSVAFAALWPAIFCCFKHSAVLHLEYLPFMLLFLSALSSITLIIDCLTSFKWGKAVALIICLFFCLLTFYLVEPIGPALERLDASGSILALRRGVSACISGTAFPFQWGIGIALSLIVGSTLFGMVYAKRIRF
jgi:hypothetical protein